MPECERCGECHATVNAVRWVNESRLLCPSCWDDLQDCIDDDSSRWDDQAPIALAYDDTDDELVARVYTVEALAELRDAWFIRVEPTEDLEKLVDATP